MLSLGRLASVSLKFVSSASRSLLLARRSMPATTIGCVLPISAVSSEIARTTESVLDLKRSKAPCVPRALVSFCFFSCASRLARSRTSAKPSTSGLLPSTGTSSTPIATSEPSHARTCDSVGPSPVAPLALALKSATSFGKLGKRAPSASRRFQASEFASMLASTNATVVAGKACAARPSVPAAPARRRPWTSRRSRRARGPRARARRNPEAAGGGPYGEKASSPAL